MPQPASVRTFHDLKEHYRSGGFFMLRSALCPFASLARIGQDQEAARTSGGTYAERRALEVARLFQELQRDDLREAIFFASTRLDGVLNAGGDLGSLTLTLAKYFTRSCTRATPFGLFAGISTGRIAASTRLEIGPRDAYRRYTRPSLAFLSELSSRAAALADPGDAMRYELNPSAYRAFERVRFSRDGADGKSHPVVDVKLTPELERALACAAEGAALEEIAQALAQSSPAPEWASDYARALVDHRVLTPCCLPPVTGAPPLESASRALELYPSLRPLAEMLADARERLARLDGQPLGHDVSGLREVARRLETSASALGFECRDVLQVDLVKPAPQLSLGQSVVQRLLDAARILQRTGLIPPEPALDEFCRRFSERYGSRSVPLVEALDGDLGLGFGPYQRRGTDAFVHGLGLEPEPPPPTVWSELDDFRLQLLTRALSSGSIEVVFDTAALDGLTPRHRDQSLPESFAVLAQLGVREGRTLIVDPVVLAPSGLTTLTRFCHADPTLAEAVQRFAALEQARAGHRGLADVAYLPAGSVGNILARPALRALEICYSGKSGASEERQLPITDLHVRVVEGRVELHSRGLGRSISIRIANAHEHGAWQNLPIYRFLAALEAADRSALPGAWSWGALEDSRFLPRVVSGDVVLSRARWWIDATELSELEGREPAAAHAWVQALRERLRLPRWVVISRGETPLVSDLESLLGVEVFVHEARRAARVMLEELLPAPDELALSGPEGKYAGEVIVPFLLRDSVGKDAARDVEFRASQATALGFDGALLRERSFVPGSEWLYAKIYAGPSLIDALAQRVALELVPGLPSGTLARWFFVPYADPETHLRLRFRGEPGILLTRVWPALQRLIEPHRTTGAVYRVQLDTYERELERYGGLHGTELAEQTFHYDSEASARVLALCAERAELRWLLTLLGVERLLADFVPEPERRTTLIDAFLVGYRQEFDVGPHVIKAMGISYRARAERLEALLWPRGGADPASEIERTRSIYRERSERMAAIVERLRVLSGEGRVLVEPAELIASLVHMHVVRLLGRRAPSHELLIYDFLRRQYVARRARTRLETRAEAGCR